MKKIVINFNNLIKQTIFNVKNKTNNNFYISNFNKILITFISLLFLYIFYLSIPILYNKNWLQNNIEDKLLKEFKIIFSTSSDISYRILPAPHFLIKDSKIFKDNKRMNSLSEIKNLKIFINQTNFFKREKIQLKKIDIDNANFSLQGKDFQLFNRYSNNQFSKKKIEINNSNIFFKKNSEETIAIIKIEKAFLLFNDEKLLNIFNLKAEAFKIPFTFIQKNNIEYPKTKNFDLKAKNLKLKIFNQFNKTKENLIVGKNSISFFNSRVDTKYNIKENLISFESKKTKINNSNIDHKGTLSFNPFDLNLNINLGAYKISKILNSSIILIDLIKTGLLFNNNISIKTSIIANSSKRGELFHDIKINFEAIHGNINFDNTKLINKKIGQLQLENSYLSLENNELIFDTNIIIDIKNTKELFSFLQTNKSHRKKIKNISISLNYNFFTNQFKFGDIKIDNNKVSDELFIAIEGFANNTDNNLNKSRRLFNDLFRIYKG